MENNWTTHRRQISLTWPTTFSVAAVLAAGVFGGLWLWSAGGRAWPALLPAAVLAVTAVLGTVGLSRARATRRLKALVDAYAEREIARGKTPESYEGSPPIMVRAHQPRVLVVDDNAAAADIIAALVRLWGFDADACYDGETALKTARTHPPQIVLLDIGLPRTDGFQVAQRLREQLGARHAVFIAVTGYANETCRRRAREVGFHHYLVKPVDPDALHKLLIREVGYAGFFQAPEADEGVAADGRSTARESPEGGTDHFHPWGCLAKSSGLSNLSSSTRK
jgi:CheY-like chemotaxis protein